MILVAEELDVYYDEIIALDGISFEVSEGEIVSIIGANGAGKTTIMNALSGIVPIKKGTVRFSNKRIDNLPSHKIVNLGMVHVPEGRMLFSHMTVLENLEMGAYLGRAKTNKAQSLEKVLDMFPDLAERGNQQASMLSGGQQQMLSIARGLMSLPKLLLLDEPSLGLAPLLVEIVFRSLNLINKEGTPILLVEQNTSLALAVSRRGYVIENGRIVLSGESENLTNNSLVKQAFLGI